MDQQEDYSYNDKFQKPGQYVGTYQGEFHLEQPISLTQAHITTNLDNDHNIQPHKPKNPNKEALKNSLNRLNGSQEEEEKKPYLIPFSGHYSNQGKSSTQKIIYCRK